MDNEVEDEEAIEDEDYSIYPANSPAQKNSSCMRGNDVRKSNVMEVSAAQLVYANDTRPFPSPAHQQRM